jgi:predicted regulator of Ras-like GTPase activity (Roadblock/LC7/MglB family)
MEEETTQKTILESVAEMAEFANAVASMVVGHRRILVEGDFDVNLADQMAAALHAQVLGLVHQWSNDEDDIDLHVLEFLVGDDEDEDDE